MTLKKANLCFVIFLLLISVAGVLLFRFPGHNGDMPFYIACVIEKEQGSMNGIQDKTLAVLHRELPASEYQDHADRIAGSPVVIFERYRIKPLYIWLVWAFRRLGFSYTDASVMPSVLSYFFIGLSLWQILRRRMDPVSSLLAGGVSLLIYPVLVLGRLSTPDAVSCLLLLNAFALIYFGGRKIVWFGLFLLAICTRLDNIVTELVLLLALWRWPSRGFSNKLSFRQFLFMAAGVVAMAALVDLTAANNRLWFNDPYFAEPPGEYLKAVTLYLKVIHGSFFMYLSLFFILSGIRRGFSWKQPVNFFFYAVCAVVFVRFLMYPFYEERYLSPLLLFSVLTLATELAGRGKPGSGLDPKKA